MKQKQRLINVHADISPDSVASAARAFQMLMALQEMGEILEMDPPQRIIETAAPVLHMAVRLQSQQEISAIRESLMTISEIDRLEIEEGTGEKEAPVQTYAKPDVVKPVKPAVADVKPGMAISFEITPDEMPIFMAEAEEQLQVLDEGLVRLEHEAQDEDIIQAIFRAAHTLKGAAGMISHKRMVDVTHMLETALDDLRKQQIVADPFMIDLCLESVDTIRSLAGEVVKGVTSDVPVRSIVDRLNQLHSSVPASSTAAAETVVQPVQFPGKVKTDAEMIMIKADISPNSVASAARALQIILALRERGEIVQMSPDQKHIDRAASVAHFVVQFLSNVPLEDLRSVISAIDEIDRLELEIIGGAAEGAEAVERGEAPRTIEAAPQALQPVTGDRGGRAGARPAEKVAEQTVRTSVERLDNLMNLVGELITDRNRVFQLRTEFEAVYRGDDRVDDLSTTVTHIGRITDQLQAEVMRIRMQPVSFVFNKYPRLVRDLARKAEKEINFTMRGEDTELDRSVIENISDPLIHLLRNSVDHGIESSEERIRLGKSPNGNINISARHEEGHIVISVQDDGRGINVDRVKSKAVERGLLTVSEAASLSHDDAIDLIFASGLSTAKSVTDISGRGVGMDIVRNNIEQLNGSILVETKDGIGTQFQIILPLTLAIVPTLLVQVGPVTFAIPLASIIQTLRIPVDTIKTVNRKPVITLRGNVLPLVRLTELFNYQSTLENPDLEFVVVVRWGKAQLGIMVDKLIGEQELVVKSLSLLLGETPGIASAAILGDGQVSLIIDIKGLFTISGMQQFRH